MRTSSPSRAEYCTYSLLRGRHQFPFRSFHLLQGSGKTPTHKSPRRVFRLSGAGVQLNDLPSPSRPGGLCVNHSFHHQGFPDRTMTVRDNQDPQNCPFTVFFVATCSCIHSLKPYFPTCVPCKMQWKIAQAQGWCVQRCIWAGRFIL